MLALPMMMIRQPETASRRNMLVGLATEGGVTYRGFFGSAGGFITPGDDLILGANGNGTIVALIQNTSNNNTYLQVQHGGGWVAGDVYGMVNLTRNIVLPAPTYSRALSPTVREWGWESGVKDLGLVVAETHTLLIRANGVGW